MYWAGRSRLLSSSGRSATRPISARWARYRTGSTWAILGANGLHLAGAIDLSKSLYQTPNFTWLSYILGGLLFGVGMTLGSGCGSKTLIRVGAGNLKSLIVYVFLGIA